MAIGCGGGGDGTQDEGVAGETPSPTPRANGQETSTPVPQTPASPTPTPDGQIAATPTPTPTGPPASGAEGLCFVAFPHEPACAGSPFPASQAECCETSVMIFVRSISGWCANDQFDASTGECIACRRPCEGLPTPTPPAPRDEGACFIGSTTCRGTFVPASREDCCNRFQPNAAAVPVSWCPEDRFDAENIECDACSDPCEGLPSPTPTAPTRPTPTPTPTAETPRGCDRTNACPRGQFCEEPVGVCANDLGGGVCVDVPQICLGFDQPVCGCDGLTYRNDCLRRAAAVHKAHDGPCPAEECRDACDCYATRTFAASCPLECANCDNYWTCEEGRCFEHCGAIPLDRCEALCFENQHCGPEAFCAQPVGRCDGLGACLPRPGGCTDEFAPVCGCDGQTYGNACEAAAAGVAVAQRGRCEEVPTPTPTPSPELCDITDPCPAGQFCELPTGVCASNLDGGTCVVVPGSCFATEPVCGCDGLTYGNDCLRRAARVQKSADGPCPTPECGNDCDCYATRTFAAACPLLCPNCGSYWTCENERCIEQCGMIPLDGCPLLCIGSRECPPEDFCRKPIAQCEGLGACRRRPPRPEPCPDVVDPVCGCDGQTYSNECHAARAGVSLAKRGECPPICGTIAGIPCPETQFCELPPGTCDVTDGEGVCVDLDSFCKLDIDPVCGCDGVTYSNDCLRLASRVHLAHRGPCTPECGTIAGIPCPDGQFCDLPPGTCNVADLGGVCVQIGDACPLVIDPVCGCDGVTYGNDCLRLQARVALAHRGACAADQP